MDAVIEFKLPELGENIEQGDLVRLMVSPGASVSTGQSVMELETDKAVLEVPSSVTGTVQEIRVKEGDKIKVGQVIFTVDGAEAKTSPEHCGARESSCARASTAGARLRSSQPELRLLRQSRLLRRPPRQSPARAQPLQAFRGPASSNSPNLAKIFLRATWCD